MLTSSGLRGVVMGLNPDPLVEIVVADDYSTKFIKSVGSNGCTI